MGQRNYFVSFNHETFTVDLLLRLRFSTSLLLSVNSFLPFYPLPLHLLLTAQPLHPSRLQWCSSGFPFFTNDHLHASASDVHSFANDSTLHKASSFQSQPSSNAHSQSCLLTQICGAFTSRETSI